MNGQFDEELLSAYHDGELPDTERQSVEDRIAEEISEAREILDDFAELSSSLRSLPTTQAPTDFRDVVMRQVQGSTAVRSKPTAAQQSRRPLLFWTAGTAASLLIAVGLFQLVNGPQPNSPAMSGAELADNAAEMSAPVMEMAAAQVFDEAAVAGGVAARAESPEPVLVASEANSMLDSAERVAANDTRLLNLLRSLAEAPDVGQHLDVVQEVGNELVLIKFQVVDVIEAYGEFQFLLDEIGIMPLDGEADDANADFVAENRMRGIFFEASNEEVLAALDEIDLLQSVVLVDTNGVDMASTLGVNRDEIPERMQLPLGFGGGGGFQAVAQANAAEPTEPSAAPSRSVTRPGASDRPAADEVESSDAEAQRDPATGAYRMHLSLPDQIVRAFEEQQQQQDAQQILEQPTDEGGNRDGQNSDDDAQPIEAADRTRSRVLLIFVADEDSNDD